MIPFGKTTLDNEEIQAISEVIKSGWVVLGKKSEEFEQQFADYVGAKYAVFVDSGTSALFLALKSLKLKKGTKVAVPSLTFTSSAEVIVNAGLKPVFTDVNKENYCMIETELENKLPVHLLGNKCSVDSVIYDSAHRIEKDDVKDSKALWCYSLYATKNMTTVQGGMIATNDEEKYNWLKKARDHGLDMGTKERYQGKYKQYNIEFVGYRVKGDDLRAVIGIEQLKKLPAMTQRRNEIVKMYNEGLGLNRVGNHVYTIMVNDRERFMNFMIENGIQCTVHFRPLHQMTGYKKYAKGVDLPNTDYIGERIISIPMFPQMTNEEVAYVISKIKESGLMINE